MEKEAPRLPELQNIVKLGISAACKPLTIKPDACLSGCHSCNIKHLDTNKTLSSNFSFAPVKSEREHPLSPKSERNRRNFCQLEVQYY